MMTTSENPTRLTDMRNHQINDSDRVHRVRQQILSCWKEDPIRRIDVAL